MTAVAAPMREAILDALHLLCEPGGVYELRVLKTRRGTVRGYFQDLEKMAAAAMTWNGRAPGVYMTINPVSPILLARANNHVEEYAKETTSDPDIVHRKWIPLDFDPVRPSGISSTDAQHDAAIKRARDAARWLVSVGVPRESIILADSGNGGHLLIEVSLPNDAEATERVRRVIAAVAMQFGDETVSVDSTSVNPARIWKVYGTLSCKGDNLPEFPHRESRLLRVPSR